MSFRSKFLIFAIVISSIVCMTLSGCNFSLVNPYCDFNNKCIYELKVGESVQLSYKLHNAEGNVSYIQSLKGIVDVSDSGLVTAVAEGETSVDIAVKCDNEEKTQFTYTIIFDVYEEKIDETVTGKNYFDVSYETNSYVAIGDKIKLNCAYIDENSNKLTDIEWKSLDEKIATVDQNGYVTGKKAGYTTILATCKTNSETFRFTVTVLPVQMSAALKSVVTNHNSNALVVYNLGIGAGSSSAYYYDVVGSVNNIIFEDFVVDSRYYNVLGKYEKNEGERLSTEFICVHYTGNMNNGADADNNADYFNYLGYTASIHWVTGRTNIDTGYYDENDYRAFNVLNESYVGWHATTFEEFCWLDTGIDVAEGDPDEPVICINSNSKFTINGRESIIDMPERVDGIEPTGPKFDYINGYVGTTINKNGIAWKCVNGRYYINQTYWGTMQTGMTLCNLGGNRNSIGIESCVDIGSDLVHTWHLTAQLVGRLLVKYDLDLNRVVGHTSFSGKNCPQPFLANDMQLWDIFMKYVEAEYDNVTKYKDTTFTAKAINSEGVLRDNGLLVQDDQAHCVTYQVEVETNGHVETITLATIVESNKKCAEERISLQAQGVEIK